MKFKKKNMIPWARPNYHGYEKKYVNQVLKSTWLGDGIFIRNFEKIFSKYIDSKSAISVSNGTIAIHLVYSNHCFNHVFENDWIPNLQMS